MAQKKACPVLLGTDFSACRRAAVSSQRRAADYGVRTWIDFDAYPECGVIAAYDYKI